MSALSQESIKPLTKSELKTELTKRGLPLNSRKDDLLKGLTETLKEESNKVDETEKHLQNISIETIKGLFIEMFKAQEETIRKIVSSYNSDTIVRLDRLSEEIQDNKERLEKVNKEAVDLKISLETSQEIFEKKFQKVNYNLSKQKQKHKEDINELWKDNDQLRERLRDVEDRFRRDNLRIDGIAEVENETWEPAEQILQNLFNEKLQLENISVERAHRVGKKEKNNKRTIVLKLASFKYKLKIISEARKLKDTNININEEYSKETLEIRKEKWKEVKELRMNGTYAILVYDKVVTKGKYRKQKLFLKLFYKIKTFCK